MKEFKLPELFAQVKLKKNHTKKTLWLGQSFCLFVLTSGV